MTKSAGDDLRRRIRAFLERTGMKQEDFAYALGKKSGSSWTAQFLNGVIQGKASTVADIEKLIASDTKAKPPAPAPAPAPPVTPSTPDDATLWPTTRLSDALRTSAENLGLTGRSLLSVAADRLDAYDAMGGGLRKLADDAHDLHISLAAALVWPPR